MEIQNAMVPTRYDISSKLLTAQTHIPTPLTDLRIYDCASSNWPAFFEKLSKSEELEGLTVYRCMIKGDISAGVGRMKRLIKLKIENYQFSVEGVEMLKGLVNLRLLNLNGGQIGDQAAKRLGNLKNIASLDLTCNNLTDESVIPLSKSLVNLQSLGLLLNNVTNIGAKHISLMPKLTELSINKNMIGDEGVKYICRGLPQLRILKLRANGLSNQAIEMISKYLKNLEVLSLRDGSGEGGRPNTFSQPHFVKLRFCKVEGIPINVDNIFFSHFLPPRQLH